LVKGGGIGLKVIVQLGVLGKGFYPLGGGISKENFVPWYEATDETIRWIKEVEPYRIMESVWQNFEGLPICRLISERRIAPYDNPRRQVQTERKRLRDNISVDWRLANQEVVESAYERFLPSHRRDMVVLH